MHIASDEFYQIKVRCQREIDYSWDKTNKIPNEIFRKKMGNKENGPLFLKTNNQMCLKSVNFDIYYWASYNACVVDIKHEDKYQHMAQCLKFHNNIVVLELDLWLLDLLSSCQLFNVPSLLWEYTYFANKHSWDRLTIWNNSCYNIYMYK